MFMQVHRKRGRRLPASFEAGIAILLTKQHTFAQQSQLPATRTIGELLKPLLLSNHLAQEG